MNYSDEPTSTSVPDFVMFAQYIMAMLTIIVYIVAVSSWYLIPTLSFMFTSKDVNTL